MQCKGAILIFILVQKVLKKNLGEHVKFTKNEISLLFEHSHIFAKYGMKDILLLIYDNNNILVPLLINNASNEAFYPKHDNDLFPIIDVLLHLENKAFIDNEINIAEKFSKQLALLLHHSNNQLEELQNYFNKYANRDSKHPLFDLCSFTLPNDDIINARHWWSVLNHIGPHAKLFLPHAAKIELYCHIHQLSLPKSRKELLSCAIAAIYHRYNEDETFAQECFKNKIPESAFDEALDIFKNQGKTFDNLPNLFIDGNEFSAPRYYLKKLPHDDKRGFILGKYTDCCQHIAHDLGKDAAINGMTQLNSGFYVIVQRPNKKGQREEIVAQSWAWLSKEGALVFDSWEFRRKANQVLLIPFIEAFAVKSQDYGINGIFVGKDGGTPKNLPYEYATILPQPLDETGFRDSKLGQWVIKAPQGLLPILAN